MARFEDTSAFCFHCRKQVLARTRNYITAPWFVLGVLSCGFFLLVWLVSKIIWQPVTRCTYCGQIIGSRPNQRNVISIGNILQGKNFVLFIICIASFGLLLFVLDKSLKEPSSRTLENGSQSTTEKAKTITNLVNSLEPPKESSQKQSPTNAPANVNDARERVRWASEYQSRRRTTSPSVVCIVSGKDNTTITIKSDAVINVKIARLLDEDGYFNELYEKGFLKIILLDTVGHEVTINR